MTKWLEYWNPEDEQFWESTGKKLVGKLYGLQH